MNYIRTEKELNYSPGINPRTGTIGVMSYKEDVYIPQLEESDQFEDYALDILMKDKGIMVRSYKSRKYQMEVGENTGGIEIKFDKQSSDTGNLYIETKEKSHPDNNNYVKSGINRNDNTILYLIGNYKCFWMFDKKFLRRLVESKKIKCKHTENKTKTSWGYLLPINEADKYCTWKYESN
jgi:hypothetical protein